MTTGNNFYDLNATRGYPLDDSATAISDAGLPMPDGLLVDICLRYPDTLGRYPYISAIHVSERLVSLVISAAETLDAVTLNPIASLVLAAPVAEGRAYQLRGLQPGVAGWVVFGSLTNARYADKFSTPAQSLLLPKTARAYPALPVPWVSKPQDEYKLEDVVRLFAGRDVAIIRDVRTIAGAPRDAIVLKLTGDLNKVLPKYTGPCGGRPESHSCSKPVLEGINEVDPDEDGNLIINFPDLSVTNVPHGLLLGTHLALPAICPDNAVDSAADVDYCASELSEISDNSESGTGSESGSSSAGSSESSELLTPTYPACYRFYSNITPPFDLAGTWARAAFNNEPSMPCPPILALGYDPRQLRAGTGLQGRALFNLPEYTENVAMLFQTAVSVAAGGRAGLIFDYRQIGGLTYFTSLCIDEKTQQLVLRRWGGTLWEAPTATLSGVPIVPGAWYQIAAHITITAAQPTRVDITASIRRENYYGTGAAGTLQVLSYAGYGINTGRMGFVSQYAVGNGFAYLYMNRD